MIIVQSFTLGFSFFAILDVAGPKGSLGARGVTTFPSPEFGGVSILKAMLYIDKPFLESLPTSKLVILIFARRLVMTCRAPSVSSGMISSVRILLSASLARPF